MKRWVPPITISEKLNVAKAAMERDPAKAALERDPNQKLSLIHI